MMNKITSIIALTLFSTTLIANPNEAMIDYSMQMMKQKGMFQQLAQCTGASATKLEKAMRGSMKNCMTEEYLNDQTAAKQCSLSYLTKETGLTEAQFESCQTSEESQPKSEYELKLEELEREQNIYFEKEELTDADEKRLTQINEEIGTLMASQQKAAMEQMGQLVKAISKASKGTTDQITLPVYHNSQVISHMTKAGEIQMGDLTLKTLPAATFSSNSDIKTIVAFYKKQLPNFKLQHDESGDYLFMETMSDNFDLLRNIQEFTSTPHINISPENNEAGLMPEGTQVVIEIAYRL